MIKIYKSKNWEIFNGTREEAIKHITTYLEDMDYIDCDVCWEEYVELYDSDYEDITVFAAYYSAYWDDDGKTYPVEIESYTKEEFKKRLTGNYSNVKWQHHLTQLDPRRDYIIV